MSIELTEKEEKVLQIVQEYLDENRQFEMNKILPFIVARFRFSSVNINKDGIRRILKSLIEKKLIVEGSKLSHDDILENIKRRKIYEYIAQNPGVYFNLILNELNLSNHVIVWHLEMLEKFEFINKTEFENHEIYFSKDYEINDAKINYFLVKDESRKIIEFLRLNDKGVSKTRLSNELGMHYYTITKYIDKLIDYEIVKQKSKSNKSLLFLNKDFF
jgi:predicted transcriptional regulator